MYHWHLEIEITESVFIESLKDTVILLDKLKNMGVRIAPDNFGTGYSSLNYLRRLPLFKLSSLHESRTELTVSIPEDYTSEFVVLESRGGFIFIDGSVQSIRAKTYTGKIYLDLKEFGENCNLKANTENGIIEMRGSRVGRKTEKGIEYHLDKQSGNTIELYRSRGNISIN